jgi:hypothetical protein
MTGAAGAESGGRQTGSVGAGQREEEYAIVCMGGKGKLARGMAAAMRKGRFNGAEGLLPWRSREEPAWKRPLNASVSVRCVLCPPFSVPACPIPLLWPLLPG